VNSRSRSSVRVAIIDDHPLFRQGLRQLLEQDARYACAGEAGDGPAALELLARERPEVAVLDVNLPGFTGLEVARRVQERRLPTRLVVLTMCNDEETFNRAMDLGVLGYVLKENAVAEVLESICAVAHGRHYLSPSISGYLLRRHERAGALATQRPGLEDLTKAERRILGLIALNKTSREIAAELFVSPRTVETHRANICAKLGLRGSHRLLQFALENRSAL
jgi:DNA-binding NarL/FixJ family response regulator